MVLIVSKMPLSLILAAQLDFPGSQDFFGKFSAVLSDIVLGYKEGMCPPCGRDRFLLPLGLTQESKVRLLALNVEKFFAVI